MIILGHPALNSPKLYEITKTAHIDATPSNTTVVFEDTNLIGFCKENDIEFALHVKNIKELVFANAYGANFALLQEDLAKKAQQVANEYLFDLKILVKIDDENKIEELALLGVDGVIFDEAIIAIKDNK